MTIFIQVEYILFLSSSCFLPKTKFTCDWWKAREKRGSHDYARRFPASCVDTLHGNFERQKYKMAAFVQKKTKLKTTENASTIYNKRETLGINTQEEDFFIEFSPKINKQSKFLIISCELMC